MCGIVGLLVKNDELKNQMGQLLTPMLVCMGDRGPDSAGLAVYSGANGDPSLRRLSLLSVAPKIDWKRVHEDLEAHLGPSCHLDSISNHALLSTSHNPERIRAWLGTRYPDIHLLSVGRNIEVYKDTGHPADLASRYNFEGIKGTHAVGHTRMATESAVTPAHAHPYTAGEDFCLVHNGSLSNPYSLRRTLEKLGIEFETDNDTEASCRYLEWRMSQGESLEEAIQTAFAELDGFYTLLMASADKIVLVRDAFACKPAVVAETEDYVAISSEFRALAHLPGIEDARIFEPAPEEIHSWNV